MSRARAARPNRTRVIWTYLRSRVAKPLGVQTLWDGATAVGFSLTTSTASVRLNQLVLALSWVPEWGVHPTSWSRMGSYAISNAGSRCTMNSTVSSYTVTSVTALFDSGSQVGPADFQYTFLAPREVGLPNPTCRI